MIQKKNLFLIGIIVSIGIISFTAMILIQSALIPNNLKLSPGEKFILSTHFPLSFSSNNDQLNLNFNVVNLIRQELLINTNSTNQKYNFELKLFGRFPIKQVQIEVATPTVVVPSGQAIGVLVSSKGVVIVGHLPINGVDKKQYYPAKEAGIKPGDILLEINNYMVNNVEEVEFILNQMDGQPLNLSCKRGNKIIHTQITPVLTEENNKRRYLLGIFIEDPAAGVGTLTFFNPETKSFAGLGHQISNFGGRPGIPVEYGEIVAANISGVKQGQPGKPGEKIGVFNSNQSPLGKINKNCKYGIYGKIYNVKDLYQAEFNKPIPAAFNSQIKTGPAEIYTVVNGNKVEKYKIDIIKVYRQKSPRDKGLIIKVTDPELLKKTGGIVQGMSGSPIIQDGMLVGAVTHVFVNDPTKGYGVLAEWMLKEMQDLELTNGYENENLNEITLENAS
ncbi:MAG TPA: SpoIVB peptidase [Bacillota bacterium]|nr:SpoIVB peptidase [Bacillota bacterium]HOL09222.1 SpoIVB peptidase [Bacillota bacterium]HPO97046.1 SpoIVB peptidase [Bacillota bacterium]